MASIPLWARNASALRSSHPPTRYRRNATKLCATPGRQVGLSANPPHDACPPAQLTRRNHEQQSTPDKSHLILKSRRLPFGFSTIRGTLPHEGMWQFPVALAGSDGFMALTSRYCTFQPYPADATYAQLAYLKASIETFRMLTDGYNVVCYGAEEVIKIIERTILQISHSSLLRQAGTGQGGLANMRTGSSKPSLKMKQSNDIAMVSGRSHICRLNSRMGSSSFPLVRRESSAQNQPVIPEIRHTFFNAIFFAGGRSSCAIPSA